MKKQSIICLVLACLFVSSVYAQNEATDAENLLQSLLNDAQNNLKDLNENWTANSALLVENVNSWENSLNSQTEECDKRDAIVADVVARSQENTRLIEWIKVTIQEKIAQNQKIYDDRCTANRAYIHGLKNDRIILRFIDFLRQALEAKESMTLLEKKQFTANFMKFLSLYHSGNTKELLAMHTELKQYVDSSAFDVGEDTSVEARTEEQIGDEHIDDNREQIDLESFDSSSNRTFSQYKQELLDLLDELESETRDKMSKSQENEVAAGSAAAEFRIVIDKELQELDRELYRQLDLKVKLDKTLREVTAAQTQCHNLLEEVTEAYTKAMEEFTHEEGKYNTRKASIEEEIEIFEYVLEVYSGNVEGGEYREQLDDYVADGSFEGEYNDREVDQIDFVDEEFPENQQEDGPEEPEVNSYPEPDQEDGNQPVEP